MTELQSTKEPARRRVVRLALIAVVLLVVYPLSVLIVVSAYWLKTDHGYNMLKQGGWHAFSKCLIQEIPVDSLKVK